MVVPFLEVVMVEVVWQAVVVVAAVCLELVVVGLVVDTGAMLQAVPRLEFWVMALSVVAQLLPVLVVGAVGLEPAVFVPVGVVVLVLMVNVVGLLVLVVVVCLVKVGPVLALLVLAAVDVGLVADLALVAKVDLVVLGVVLVSLALAWPQRWSSIREKLFHGLQDCQSCICEETQLRLEG